MAANTQPITPVSGRNPSVLLTNASPAADTAHNGANSLELVPKATNGCIVGKVTMTPKGTNAAQVIRIYVSADDGTTNYLLKEFAFAATTNSDTVIQPAQEYQLNRVLKSTESLRVSQSVLVGAGTNAGMYVSAEVGDY